MPFPRPSRGKPPALPTLRRKRLLPRVLAAGAAMWLLGVLCAWLLAWLAGLH